MTERVQYQPTARQQWWDNPECTYEARLAEMPSDAEIKAEKSRKPWGLRKRDLKLALISSSSEYQRGLWQGRVDAIRDLDYSEERGESAYNAGYHNGYTGFKSDWRGLDPNTRERLNSYKEM